MLGLKIVSFHSLVDLHIAGHLCKTELICYLGSVF